MRKVNVIASMVLVGMVTWFVYGCSTVGKGARITVVDKLDKNTPKPYPVIDLTTVTTTTTNDKLQQMSITTTSSEIELITETETTVVEEPISPLDEIAVQINYTETDNTNIEDTQETPNVFEHFDGYFPSVDNGFITEEERIYLCNAVGSEYGSDWVSIYDKALVVDTIMTRVYNGGWTNGLESNVYNVLTAPGQYNPWYAEGYYHDNVTESCIDAVEYYFLHMDEFPHYTSFWGDGVENHFYN